jgi:glycosyltransferase involved in cell wall biosynthesis
MKVCQLCAVDFTLKNFLLPLIDGMQARGWEVTAVCSDGPFVAELRSRGYRIEPVRIARSMHPGKALRSLVSLIRLFRRERFDVLHVHTPVAALIGRFAAWVAGIPLVIYTAHGFYFHDEMPRWKRMLFVWMERLGGRLTDLLFSQSAEDTEEAVKERIIECGRAMTIGNGVNVDRFNPEQVDPELARDALGIPKDAFVVGLVGRQVREKGVGEFLKAVEYLATRYPHLWVLLVGERLGSDHAHGVEAEFARARSILGERLVAPGLCEDMPAILAAMDLFCLPSWREGMPRTIIEAMMMAKPVVATNIRGSREEVVPGKTGTLVPTRDPARLASAISELVENPQVGHQMGLAGRQRALDLFDERHIVRLQLERIEMVASSRLPSQ